MLCRLVPVESSKPNIESKVGGVLGGVIGSRAEADGEGESVLSSVRLSGPSVWDNAEDPERYADRRVELRLKAAVR